MATAPSGVGQFSFCLKQNSDTTLACAWTNNGAPVDLTGYQMALTIRAFVNSPIALLSLTSSTQSGSRIVIGGNTGLFSIVFAHADTVGLVANGLATSNPLTGGLPISQLGVYDLQTIDPSGNIGYPFEGQISLDPRVT
ncbi:MAG TPA: hypothetical protein VF534_27465 [Paraburkholderia sp.]